MANITIQIPDNQMNNVVDAFTKFYGYTDTLPDPQDPTKTIANPETKPQFVQRMVRNFIKEIVAGQQGQIAQQAAVQAAKDAIG